MVTVPGLSGCRYCLWLPRVRASTQPCCSTIRRARRTLTRRGMSDSSQELVHLGPPSSRAVRFYTDEPRLRQHLVPLPVLGTSYPLTCIPSLNRTFHPPSIPGDRQRTGPHSGSAQVFKCRPLRRRSGRSCSCCPGLPGSRQPMPPPPVARSAPGPMRPPQRRRTPPI